MNACKICGSLIDIGNRSSYAILTDKGATTIREKSKERKDTGSQASTIEKGDCVHNKCRQNYTNPKAVALDKKRKHEQESTTFKKPKLRSSASFDYKTSCLYCTCVIFQRDFRDRKAYMVMSKNREFELEVCEKRTDDLAVSVKGRVSFANDLHAADAVYHVACDAAFRSGNSLPKKFSDNYSESSTTSFSGRPVSNVKEKAFNDVIDYLRENDDEQITITDLVALMQGFLEGSDEEAYSAKYFKKRLLETLKDDIVIAQAAKET